MKKINENSAIRNTEYVDMIDMLGELIWCMGDIGELVLKPSGSIYIYKQFKCGLKFTQNDITLYALRLYELSI